MGKTKKVEVLITTMNMNDVEDILSTMNIQTSAMVGNQTNYNSVELKEYKGKQCKVYSFCERGVGLNRNNLLMRTDADYCLFGDDDLIYKDGYEKIVIEAFEKYPSADVIVFNLQENQSNRYVIEKDFKVNYLNFMRFGAARIAIRTKGIKTNGILFNTCFGGGTEHAHGEDTLFLASCLKEKLNVFAVAITIAELTDERESTWFKGYDDKYFLDKGVLYYVMSKRYYWFLCLQDVIRHKKSYQGRSIKKNFLLMLQGIKQNKRGE